MLFLLLGGEGRDEGSVPTIHTSIPFDRSARTRKKLSSFTCAWRENRSPSH